MEIRARIDKLDCIKLKSFYTLKEAIVSEEMEWRMFACYSLDKRLIYRIYKEFKNFNTKGTNNLINKWANELNRQFSKGLGQA
jgi:uridine kinase